MKKASKKSVTNPPQKVSVETIRYPRLPQAQADNRIPPVGSIIKKTYKGQPLEIEVMESGFKYQGKIFKSISAVAMYIVQRPISGYVFFGLDK